MKKAIIFVVLAMILVGFCAAQSANDAQRIVGTWVSESGNTFVFNANGTGTSSGNRNSNRNGNFDWGVSISGLLCVFFPNNDSLEREIFYLSPDSKRIIFNGTVFQKK